MKTGALEGGMRVDTDLVRQLAELLNENDLTEIEVEDGDRKIVVKRQLAAAAAPAAAPAAAAAPRRAGARRRPPPAVSPANHPGAVKSPMVGTVFLAGEPGAKPFVSPGDKVEGGRHPADHRGDEGDEPDHRAARRHGHARCSSRTPSRSNMTSRW